MRTEHVGGAFGCVGRSRACGVLRGLGVVEGGYFCRLGRTRALLATGGEEQGEV